MISKTKTLVQLRSEARPVSWATGPAVQLHELAAVMRERVRAGEVEIVGPFRAHPYDSDLVVQPYVVLSGRRRRLRTPHLVGGAIAVYLLIAAVLVWEARHLLLAAVGAVALVASIVWLLSRAKKHCGGCQGV